MKYTKSFVTILVLFMVLLVSVVATAKSPPPNGPFAYIADQLDNILNQITGLSKGDGVVDINQDRALAGGVTPSDTAGFPVTIDTPGSYRLTGNLTVSDENTNGIEIMADSVTIDLNGFAILGPTVCSSPPTSCSPTGSGDGISGRTVQNVTVANGTISGMGDDGIDLALNARVEGLHASHNGSKGISVSFDSVVTDNTSDHNGSIGILAFNSTVNGNNALRNGQEGYFGNDNVWTNNTASSNDGNGMEGNASVAIGNTIVLNGGFGLTGNQFGYSNNVISANAGGTVSGGVELGTNLCDGNTTCP